MCVKGKCVLSGVRLVVGVMRGMWWWRVGGGLFGRGGVRLFFKFFCFFELGRL